MKILSIKESDFSCNTSEGIFFNSNGQRMTPNEQKRFSRNNIAIGYEGSDPKLSNWTRKQSKGLPIFNLPGETVEQKRQLLWQAITEIDEKLKKEKLKKYSWLISLAKRQDLNNLTFWYLSSHDKPVAELILRFINWWKTRS